MGLFSSPYGLIKGPTFIKFWKLLKKKVKKRPQCLDWYRKWLKFWYPSFIQHPLCYNSVQITYSSFCIKFWMEKSVWQKVFFMGHLEQKKKLALARLLQWVTGETNLLFLMYRVDIQKCMEQIELCYSNSFVSGNQSCS